MRATGEAYRRSGMTGRVRWILEFIFLFGMWWVYVSKFALSEAVTGVVAAALGATLTELFRAAGISLFFPYAAVILRCAWAVAFEAVRDCWTLLRILAMRPFGGAPLAGLRVTGFDPGTDDSRSVTRRALAVALMSVAPNTIGIEIDRDERLLLFHQLEESKVPQIVRCMRRP